MFSQQKTVQYVNKIKQFQTFIDRGEIQNRNKRFAVNVFVINSEGTLKKIYK